MLVGKALLDDHQWNSERGVASVKDASALLPAEVCIRRMNSDVLVAVLDNGANPCQIPIHLLCAELRARFSHAPVDCGDCHEREGMLEELVLDSCLAYVHHAQALHCEWLRLLRSGPVVEVDTGLVDAVGLETLSEGGCQLHSLQRCSVAKGCLATKHVDPASLEHLGCIPIGDLVGIVQGAESDAEYPLEAQLACHMLLIIHDGVAHVFHVGGDPSIEAVERLDVALVDRAVEVLEKTWFVRVVVLLPICVAILVALRGGRALLRNTFRKGPVTKGNGRAAAVDERLLGSRVGTAHSEPNGHSLEAVLVQVVRGDRQARMFFPPAVLPPLVAVAPGPATSRPLFAGPVDATLRQLQQRRPLLAAAAGECATVAVASTDGALFGPSRTCNKQRPQQHSAEAMHGEVRVDGMET
mmetsp:Transcript_66868/g.216104  ORF Transcript_66868/g.216104 Transcript_66868/m.216104 type:complete len:413 (-) Transcript_66868:41-1279(-)